MFPAARTKNYSCAELEGVVKSAVSFALNRQLSLDDLTKPVDEESIKVTMDDFRCALPDTVPAFGACTDDLESIVKVLRFSFYPLVEDLRFYKLLLLLIALDSLKFCCLLIYGLLVITSDDSENWFL
jgi:hypothetical protein